MKKLLIFLFLVISAFLTSCSHNELELYSKEKPVFNPQEFFQGKLVAKGIVTDRKGAVIRRFYCDIIASWDGDEGTLDESFLYSDGKKEKRIWKISFDKEKGTIIGRAHDVVDKALGEIGGNAFHFEYTLKVPVDDSVYEINFDDWMYLLDESTLMAKTEMSKFGLNVGEVNLVMTKESK